MRWWIGEASPVPGIGGRDPALDDTGPVFDDVRGLEDLIVKEVAYLSWEPEKR